MTTYVILATVDEQEFQNAQELASIWGDVRIDVEELGGELLDSYAILGEYDFLITFEVDDEDAAFEIALAIERYGLDTRTMRARRTEEFGEIVDDS